MLKSGLRIIALTALLGPVSGAARTLPPEDIPKTLGTLDAFLVEEPFQGDLNRMKVSLRSFATSGEKGLVEKKCGYNRRCYYDSAGELRYWAQSVSMMVDGGTDRWGNFKVDKEKRFFFTGGYPQIKAKQQAYADWVKKETSWSLRYHMVDPVWIPVTGEFNHRTLKIPAYMAKRELEGLWRRFTEDCVRASIGLDYPICEETLHRFYIDRRRVAKRKLKHGEKRREIRPKSPKDKQVIYIKIEGRGGWDSLRIYLFPNPALKMRAISLEKVLAASIRLEKLVESVEPYNPGRTVGAAFTWKRKVGPDHLEPEQLTAEFWRKIQAVEKETAKAIANAQILDGIR